MTESVLSSELQKARHNVATLGFKPMFPQISLEIRQSLASVLSTEESIDHLTAVKRLHRPLTDETPLWEEYSDIAEWLDEMDAEDKETENLRLQYQDECENRLREAVRDFERFLAGNDGEPGPPEESKLSRRTMSKDDLQVGVAANGGKELRRRPSFMADMSQGRIEVDNVETTFVKPEHLPVTSTPHVPNIKPNRAPRVSDVKAPVNLFDAGESAGSSRPRAPSLTRVDYVRSKTFDRITAGNETKVRAPQATFVTDAENDHQEPAAQIAPEEPNATIVKSATSSEELQNPRRPGNVPRIATGQSRPTIATRPNRETKLQKPSKFASKIQVLPSKAGTGVPARQLPTRKPAVPSKEAGSASSISSTSSSSRTGTAIAKPSKPLRPALRK